MKKLALIILCGFLFTGCAFFLGFRDPKVETPTSLITYLKKHKIDTTNLWLLKPNYIDTLKATPFKKGFEPGFRPIQFKMFTQKGKLVAQYSSCEGSLSHFDVLDQFPPKNLFPVDSSYTIQQDLEMYTMLNSKPIVISHFDTFDYIILAYWQVFAGSPSRNMIKQLENYVEQHAQKKCLLIKVNTDVLHADELYRYN